MIINCKSLFHKILYKVLLQMDGDKLVQNEHWADKKATIVHELNGDDWTTVSQMRRCNLVIFEINAHAFFIGFDVRQRSRCSSF